VTVLISATAQRPREANKANAMNPKIKT